VAEEAENVDLNLEAADWFLRLQDEPDSDTIQEELAAWLQTSGAHQTAWHQICATWGALGALETSTTFSETPIASRSKSPDFSQQRRPARPLRSRRWVRGGSAAALAVAAMLLMLVLPDIMLLLRADHITKTAETRLIELEDGSRILLSADSAIAIELSRGKRSARLLSGRAYFDVAKDNGRPFVVMAGVTNVTVLGTAFDVRFSESSTSVELAHGAVSVSTPQNEAQSEFKLSPSEALYLDHSANQVIKRDIAQEDIGVWREGVIFVEDEPLSAVVDELQRYHGAWITIASPSLAQQRVTGLFDLRNPDDALSALVRPLGARMRKITSKFRTLSYY